MNRPFAISLAPLLLVPLLHVSPAAADALSESAGRYAITSSSSIEFSVSQVGGGGIRGRFPDFSGQFLITAPKLEGSRVDFALAPGTVSTGQARVESFLKSSAVFDATRFPQITFTSRSVKRTGENSAVIDGVLHARDHSFKAQFQATLVERTKRGIVFHVTGKVPRAPFGMGIGVPIYSNDVYFDMTLRGRRR